MDINFASHESSFCSFSLFLEILRRHGKRGEMFPTKHRGLQYLKLSRSLKSVQIHILSSSYVTHFLPSFLLLSRTFFFFEGGALVASGAFRVYTFKVRTYFGVIEYDT